MNHFQMRGMAKSDTRINEPACDPFQRLSLIGRRLDVLSIEHRSNWISNRRSFNKSSAAVVFQPRIDTNEHEFRERNLAWSVSNVPAFAFQFIRVDSRPFVVRSAVSYEHHNCRTRLLQ